MRVFNFLIIYLIVVTLLTVAMVTVKQARVSNNKYKIMFGPWDYSDLFITRV